MVKITTPPGNSIPTEQSPLKSSHELQDRTIAIQTGMLNALNLRPEQVDLVATNESAFEFMIRFQKTNKFEVLPSTETLKNEVNRHLSNGTSKQIEGTYKGASHVLLGTIQFDESTIHGDRRNHVSVTMRLVDTTSGQILEAGDSQMTSGSVVLGKTMAAVIHEARQRMRQ